MQHINPIFKIVGPNDTTRDYGDNLNNFKGIVDAINANFDLIDASIVKSTYTTKNASMYWTAPDTSIWSWAITKV